MNYNFPFQQQKQLFDCGITCLAMISSFHGRAVDESIMEQLRLIYDRRLSLLDLREIGLSMNLDVIGIKVSFEELNAIVPLPCIVHWKESHFVVVYEMNDQTVHIADPAHVISIMDKHKFIDKWLHTEDKGFVLAIEAL